MESLAILPKEGVGVVVGVGVTKRPMNHEKIRERFREIMRNDEFYYYSFADVAKKNGAV